MPCFYLIEIISSFIFFRYVYRFVCDLQALLGYTPEDLHRMGDLPTSVKKEDETTDAEDAGINERDRFLWALNYLVRSTKEELHALVDLHTSVNEDENTNGEEHEYAFIEV